MCYIQAQDESKLMILQALGESKGESKGKQADVWGE
jgi:hypothetical protein